MTMFYLQRLSLSMYFMHSDTFIFAGLTLNRLFLLSILKVLLENKFIVKDGFLSGKSNII